MNHTRYENKLEEDASRKWLTKKFGKTTPLLVGLNKDGTIRELEIGKKLTKAEKQEIIDKFPELEGKEIG